MGRQRLIRLLAVAAIAVAGLVAPATVSAHPLGNFTINHYAGLTVAADHLSVDVVIDMAEIPTFQERQTMDVDEDGSVADEEAAAWASTTCRDLPAKLRVTRDGDTVLPLETNGGATATFLPGAGGLSTLRLECGYRALLSPTLGSSSTAIGFVDGSYTERIGWREIVAGADGTILDTHGLPATSPSQKLTSYPADKIATPLDIRSATIAARLDPAAVAIVTPAGSTTSPAGAAPVAAAAGAVPGGVAGELPDIFRTADLTPFVVLASLAVAAWIGALHALTPGHGKTLMAAYLVGTRGTAVHAVGLGLSVAISHTLGILALALTIVGAGSVLPPDVVYRVTPVVAGASIVAIGGWMLIAEARRRRGARALAGERAGGVDHEHAHEHEPNHAHEHGHAHAADHEHEPDHAHEHEPDHAHEHEPGHEHGQAAVDHAEPSAGPHRHGGLTHTHLPPAGRTLTWRGLFILGLAGGLIPSTSALIVLLGSIAAGRPAFGLLLVVAFGVGMAAVMTGVGLVMILARTRLDRMPSRSSLGRLATAAPLVASVAVLGLGLVLTWQAIAGSPVL